jgi:hypothetical protein
MADPWAFGWTQLFTLVGFLITIIIAVTSFRTFGRWRPGSASSIMIGAGARLGTYTMNTCPLPAPASAKTVQTGAAF